MGKAFLIMPNRLVRTPCPEDYRDLPYRPLSYRHASHLIRGSIHAVDSGSWVSLSTIIPPPAARVTFLSKWDTFL